MNPRRPTPQGPKPCSLDQDWKPPHEATFLFSDSFYFKEHWVFWVWARVDYDVFVFCPREFCAIAHCVDFGQNRHQSAVAYGAVDCSSVEVDFVADLAAETTFSLHALDCDFNFVGHVNPPCLVALLL